MVFESAVHRPGTVQWFMPGEIDVAAYGYIIVEGLRLPVWLAFNYAWMAKQK